MTTFAEYAAKTGSEKIVLATINSIVQAKLFDVESGDVYKKVVPFFVTAVQEGEAYYTEAASSAVNAKEFYYDPATSTLYIQTEDSVDPKTLEIFITYKHFFASKSVLLPYDLSTGATVEWDGRISDIGELTLEIDSEFTAIACESDSSIKLINDGYFDDLFETHIWENQEAKFYSWSPILAATEAKLIYDGLINNKSFSPKEVGFTLKDLLFKLRSTVSYNTFTSADGTVSEDMLDKPKSIIIGRASKIKCEGIDKTLDGFLFTPGWCRGSADRNLLSGRMSGTIGSTTITGVGTSFTTEVNMSDKLRFFVGSLEFNYTVASVDSNTQITLSSNVSMTFTSATARNMNVLNNIVTGNSTAFKTYFSPNDKIVVFVQGFKYEYRILSVDSNTQMTLDDEIRATFSSLQSKCKPEIPYRGKNRYWNIAGHALRSYSTTVTKRINSQWLELESVGEIEANDVISINGYLYSCERVSGNTIRLNQAEFERIAPLDTVTKIPVFKAYYGESELVYLRDYTIGTSSDGSTNIEINSLAEFNITDPKTLMNTYVFTSASPIVTCQDNTVDLTEIFKPRDWIKPKTVTITTWNEILSVSSTTIALRANYTDASYTGVTDYKSPSYINDNSLIAVDCIGLENTTSTDSDFLVDAAYTIVETDIEVASDSATIDSDLTIDGVLTIGQTDVTGWVKTPSDAVKWVLDSVGIDNQEVSTFNAAKDDCPYLLSLVYSSDTVKNARDMITDINKSSFGSLYLDSEFKFCYSNINCDMDETVEELTDSDILGFTVSTKQNIINEVLLEYGQTTNLTNGQIYFQREIVSNGYVDKTSKIEVQFPFKVFFFNQADAQAMAYRLLLFRGSTQTSVTVKSKLNLYLKSINDRMYLSLDRLFSRFASSIKKKIGIINKITKDELSTTVQFNDMGGIYSKVAVIAPNSTPDFGTATELNIAQWGFIVDNDTETPDVTSEDELGNNLIG